MPITTRHKLLATVLAMTAGTIAAEERQTYAETSFAQLKYEETGYSATPSAARLIIGTKIHKKWGLEAMGAIGVSDGTTSGVALSLDNGYGVYLKGAEKFGEKFEIFGRFGTFRGNLTATGPAASISTSGTDFSYGGGIGYSITDNVSLIADYMSYYNKGSIKISGWSLGARFGF
jgi:hypothetical protein